MTRVITFGEIMLRLKSPGYERLFQSPVFEATFGGSEVNVAVSLAQFGMDTAFMTILPNNEITSACLMELRRYGVDTSLIQYGKGRFGLYYLESGANQRPSKVTYDRVGSSIAVANPDSIDWKTVFKGSDWFHLSGITPALSDSASSLSLNAVKIAKEMGLTISCDLNYRAQLWKYGKTPPEVMGDIVSCVDICIANIEAIRESLGIKFEVTIDQVGIDTAKYHKTAQIIMGKFPNIKLVAITLRDSKSANHHNWSACIFDGEQFIVSTRYSITDIVDRVGGGDSFCAGLIYGLNHYSNKIEALEYAAAASCLKHSIVGDFNRVSPEEVELLMTGDKTGRMKR